MSLRRDVHSAFDVIAPPLGGMPERMVQTVLAEHNARRRKRKMLVRMRTPLSLVAVFLLVALVAAVLVGGRLVQDWNAFHKPVPAAQPHSSLSMLEARPLHLPTFRSVVDCTNGPYNSEGDFGTGPVFGVGGSAITTHWGSYFYVDFYADHAVDGPILVRAGDLFKRSPVVFVGEFAAGPVVGTDTVNGVTVEQHSELVLYTSSPSAQPPGGWIRPTNQHPYVWYVMPGARNDTSASHAFQIDGIGFSEVFVAC